MPTVLKITLDDGAAQRLKALQTTVEADATQVIRNALRLYDHLIERDRAGKPLFEADGSRFVPFLPD